MALTPPRVALDFLGCKANQAEVEEMAQGFRRAGYALVSAELPAEVYILNTCTITHVADRKARLLVHQATRRNPGAVIICTGCYATIDPDALSAIPGVDLVVPNADKSRIVDIVRERVPPPSAPGIDAPPPRLWDDDETEHRVPLNRTRSMLKVQDGCEGFCTYCIVPQARGRVHSEPIDTVVNEINQRVALGYQEVVLTGIALGSYGRDWNSSQTPHALHHLVEAILSRTRLPRLRLSSVEPESLDVGLLEMWSDDRFCRHLHLPLQSGSDTTLKRMGRRYRCADFAALAERAHAIAPDAALTTDMIVGFPGETDEEFRQSYGFAEEMGFAKIHVFRFSARRGTPAARLPGMVLDGPKKERAAELMRLSDAGAAAFRRRFLDTQRAVLWEEPWPARSVPRGGAPVWWTGLTDNYIRAYALSQANLRNRLLAVRLEGEFEGGLRAEFT